MDFIISILSIIFILSIPVFLHELGHYMAARSVGIRVEKFYVGMNLFGMGIKKVINGTEYGIGLFPLGGYVKVSGIIDESLDSEKSTSEPQEHEFRSKNTFQKLWFLSAGVLMNFLLSIVIFTFLYFFNGSYELVEEPIINSISETIEISNPNGGDIETVLSPAAQLGLKKDDKILRIDGIDIKTWSDISINLSNKADSIINIEWLTSNGYNKSSSVKLVGRPAFDGKKIINQGILGVMGNTIHREISFFESFQIAVLNTGNIIVSSFYGFIGIISGNMPLEYVSGIVGIAGVASEQAKTGGLIALISLMAFISANLGLINILPIPGLDGGHALLSIIEGVIGRELPIKIKYTIQFIGIFLILSLFIFTIFNDIRNIFN
tara:strand:- start:811 stop:1947 length:1137 start_codon:yes stop_codon:yes gene_type:complete